MTDEEDQEEECDFCEHRASNWDNNGIGLCDDCFGYIVEVQPENGVWH